MDTKIILVKNMVCARCIMAVEAILNEEQIPFQKVIFGEIHLEVGLDENQKAKLKNKLSKIGFEMIDNQNSGLIEKIKQLVIKKARNEVENENRKLKLSQYIV
jgi:AraC family transcriptional regulator